ncbi:ribonuclease P protein subunit [archaeon]|jgi:ribonuclease P protein subunit POP4|nr:ribonuclease P protein subunit [archaeon]MBT6824002.1 ribonuclease P protein subunit [archaeon]MBT7107235.1 ribonuclease P protein subunit [archaeon]MBT7297156.1 ribonuclease P protein subunit [archaeon]
MKKNLKDMMRSEFIGSEIEVIDSKNKSLIGLKGKVINETKNTLTIKTKDSKKIIIKEQITIKINEKVINGEKISIRPEERIKK